jgi:hypothetical protein
MQKQAYTYPGTDFDKSKTLIALLGSFWSRTFTGRDQVASYVLSTAHTVNQTYQNLLEVVAALSRYDVPLFHEETLVPVVIKKSDTNSVQTTGALFDDNTQVFNGAAAFDRAPNNVSFFSFPLPANLADVGQFFNRITFPTAALLGNVDFVIDRNRGAIVFKTDPFSNPAFLRRSTSNDGVEDEEITLWGFCGKFDYDLVFNQFAYAVGIKLQTSQGYKDLINAIMTAMVEGGVSAAALDLAFSAICGIPVSVEPTETVEVAEYDAAGLFIATDKTVYRFNSGAVPNVVVGQVIQAGTQLVRGIDIKEFFVGNTYAPSFAPNEQLIVSRPTRDVLVDNAYEQPDTGNNAAVILNPVTTACQNVRRELTALALDGGYLSACFYGDLVFDNTTVPLEVITDHPTKYTYVRFKLGGFPADVDQFFEEIHLRGIAAARAPKDQCDENRRRQGTLAHLLDSRVQPATEPTAAHLPATINPLQFLVENVLRNNVFVVRILVPALGQNSVGLYNIRHLRQLLPPQTGMIVVFELSAGADAVKAENSVTEVITRFTGMQPQRDTVPSSLVRETGPTARLVSGTCQ